MTARNTRFPRPDTRHAFPKHQPHQFRNKREEAEFVAGHILDPYFRHWFTVDPVTLETDKRGIDRLFTDPRGRVLTVEYKCDSRAAETGNAFVETVSVDYQDKLGWAYTCQAQVLVYHIPPTGEAIILDVFMFKQHVPLWEARYPLRRSDNERYNTLGLLVPLKELRAIAYNIVFTRPKAA